MQYTFSRKNRGSRQRYRYETRPGQNWQNTLHQLILFFYQNYLPDTNMFYLSLHPLNRGVEQLVARRAQYCKFKAVDGYQAKVFINYGSEIHLVEADKRQRKPRSAVFRNAWELILQWAVPKVISE